MSYRVYLADWESGRFSAEPYCVDVLIRIILSMVQISLAYVWLFVRKDTSRLKVQCVQCLSDADV